MKNKVEIILIPGAFNPPTNAHIEMSRVLYEKFPEASVLYVPALDKYITGWKGQCKPIPFEDRGSLLDDAIVNVLPEKCGAISVSPIEQEVKTGKTYDVLNWLRKHFRNVKFHICIGEDKLNEIPKWYKGKELWENESFIVMTRPCEETVDYPDNCTRIRFDYPTVSSTKIREAYLSGNLEQIKAAVPENVYEYLSNHKGLFKGGDTNV